MIIYTLINQKGGVGKTTTAINLGACLAKHGKRVLIVDMDPQANATSSLGYNKNDVKYGTYGVLIGEAAIEQQILRNDNFNLSLLPAAPALAGAEIELIQLQDRELRLSNALKSVSDRFDYVLIDCPPSLNQLTINALIAAQNGVIIPVQCEFYALEGIGQLLSTIREIKKTFNRNLYIEGGLLTMYDARTTLSKEVSNNVRAWFKDTVYKAYIPHNVKLAEAPSYGVSIFEHEPRSEGAKGYALVAKELIARNS